MAANSITQNALDSIFPRSKSDEFFAALYGGAEEGAYDIVLTCDKVSANRASCAFELRRRPGKCLKCSLTYGLPDVFRRHPLLNVAGVAGQIAKLLGWENYEWQLDAVREAGDDLHIIPFEINRV